MAILLHNPFPALHSEPNVLDESQGLLDEGNLSRYSQCSALCVCVCVCVCVRVRVHLCVHLCV